MTVDNDRDAQRTPMTPIRAKGLLAAAGILLVSVGAALYSPPAGLITAGIILLICTVPPGPPTDRPMPR